MLARAFVIFCLTLGNAAAMDFSVVHWRGHAVVFGSGVIEAGDLERLEEISERVSPLPHGYPVILLDSPGGSVSEAFKISEFFDQTPLHTVVPDGSTCASACASILFVGGELRTVEEGAALGQHSCSLNGVQHQECNELISDHAVSNGVSHGSIAAFVTYSPPEEMIWFSRADADCWGITRYSHDRESGFDKSEPCVLNMLTGRYPSAQAAWRIDFFHDGYRAFLRPGTDHQRELQLNLYCDEKAAGKLFLGMEIGGPANVIRNAVTRAIVRAAPVEYGDAEFSVEQMDEAYSHLVITIPRDDVMDFLTRSDQLAVELQVTPPYQAISATTYLAGSREALLFAANHCINQ